MASVRNDKFVHSSPPHTARCTPVRSSVRVEGLCPECSRAPHPRINQPAIYANPVATRDPRTTGTAMSPAGNLSTCSPGALRSDRVHILACASYAHAQQHHHHDANTHAFVKHIALPCRQRLQAAAAASLAVATDCACHYVHTLFVHATHAWAQAPCADEHLPVDVAN